MAATFENINISPLLSAPCDAAALFYTRLERNANLHEAESIFLTLARRSFLMSGQHIRASMMPGLCRRPIGYRATTAGQAPRRFSANYSSSRRPDAD